MGRLIERHSPRFLTDRIVNGALFMAEPCDRRRWLSHGLAATEAGRGNPGEVRGPTRPRHNAVPEWDLKLDDARIGNLATRGRHAMAGEPTLWGIHAGRGGVADPVFREKSCVALGWPRMPDLTTLADRDAYKERLRQEYPEAKKGAIPNWAGQLLRFVQEMQVGDLVIYPSKADRMVKIGRVTGPYEHVVTTTDEYPHRRSVEWLGEYPRTSFSQGALFEISSWLSFFQVKNYADDFLAALEGRQVAATADEDETVALVAEEIETTTRDFVIKQFSRELKGHPFAQFVGDLLEAMGYRTRVSPPGPDQGVDVLAYRDQLGIEPPIIKVEVKSGSGSIGEPEVARLFGAVASGEFGLFVTLASFTTPAKRFAASKSNLRLLDGDDIVRLALEHYEKLDSRYKGLIPLKQVYIPEAIEDAEQ